MRPRPGSSRRPLPAYALQRFADLVSGQQRQFLLRYSHRPLAPLLQVHRRGRDLDLESAVTSPDLEGLAGLQAQGLPERLGDHDPPCAIDPGPHGTNDATEMALPQDRGPREPLLPGPRRARPHHGHRVPAPPTGRVPRGLRGREETRDRRTSPPAGIRRAAPSSASRLRTPAGVLPISPPPETCHHSPVSHLGGSLQCGSTAELSDSLGDNSAPGGPGASAKWLKDRRARRERHLDFHPDARWPVSG